MSVRSATPLFVDTGALYARVDEDDRDHDRARTVFRAIHRGDLPFRPVYTSGYVLVELAGLIQQRRDTPTAVDHVQRVRDSPRITVRHVDEEVLDHSCTEFERYDDHDVSLVDHSSAVLADAEGIEHVFTFDPDDFETLGLTPVPRGIDFGAGRPG